ncbi:alpha/beta hydrolase [Niabella yanshanensis]|uniref:Alpha/beta hydrolase n=1 Tax=Niabella yanshanensis TaxID=577386 RepID=A0ABZ0W796_9BACT|nr:alpha/beta hydrolase [Niabella yanshanensis]WQD38539.1 alpha/beta hydrolase [Niabella yanshanensis]
MNRYNLFFFFLILHVSGFTAKAQHKETATHKVHSIENGKVYIITQTKASYKIDSARYAVFIPEGITSINGVLIHQHGCTMEGRGMATAYDVQYQAFAKKWNLAIVGPDLYAKNNCHDWKNPGSGSADALLTTLNQVSVLAKIPSLKNAPWLLWGHSGGGYWSQAMMAAYPERVMALFSYSPGLNASFNYPEAAMQIPVMIRYAGPEGDACCWESAVRTFNELRKGDGMVSIALTRYQNHNYSFVRYMAIPFFEAVMQQRMPEKAASGFTAMRPIDRSKAWLGDTASLNIYPERHYPGEKLSASWLTDSITAVKWREYIITGTITDRTAPPAPYGLKLLRRHNMTVELSWKADADIESGISHFNIYKDGNLINRFPSSGIYQGFDTNGDNAFPMTVAPLHMEITVAANDTGKIEISTVNHFGLESAKVLCPR